VEIAARESLVAIAMVFTCELAALVSAPTIFCALAGSAAAARIRVPSTSFEVFIFVPSPYQAGLPFLMFRTVAFGTD
jgi:hypothetical protein